MVLVVVTDFVEFCGYPLFLAVLADKMKEGKSLFMIDWLFYQQYHFANACSQSSTTEMEFPNGK